MQKFYSLFLLLCGLMFSVNSSAQDELLWDYTETAPSANPDNGLYYASKVNDAAGTKNGLKGIKMNSTGYCYFTKNAVAGTLKLTFGPRSGSGVSSLYIYTYKETPGAETCIDSTAEVTELQTVSINLTADQNNIYIKRRSNTEQVVTKIQFTTGGAGPQAVKVTYKDQNGKVLGTRDAYEGDELGEVPYSEKDLTFGQDSAFRAWTYTSGVKVKATDVLKGNTTVVANVTAIESATLGSVQTYNFTSNIFYPEDHETITTADGAFHDSTHGWAFKTGGSVSVQVAGNAQVVLSLCKYSKKGAITVMDVTGAQVARIDSAYVSTDGATACINYKGDATTLTFTFTEGESYLHNMKVYNVKDFVEKDANTGYYIIPEGDGAALLAAINSANNEKGAKIFLPNGTYDLGEATGITISGDNMSIIGQGGESIIKTAPNVKLEGLGSADLLLNTADNLYMSHITLENDLDYYGAGSAGRAASFHDKGDRTICFNVALKSHQDTYYTNKDGAYCYIANCNIFGTVDYICGGGNIYFYKGQLNNLSRSATGQTGECTMTAPYTAATDKGYVFDGVTVSSQCESFNFGRSWKDGKCAFLNTFLGSGKLVSTRWTLAGMNSAATAFKEYNSYLPDMSVDTPESYVATFTHKDGNKTYETILTKEEADALSYDAFFADANWDPRSICAMEESPEIVSATTTTLTMAEEGTYKICKGDAQFGEFVGIFSGKEIKYSFDPDVRYEVCKANGRGDFGYPSAFGRNQKIPIADAIAAPAAQKSQSSSVYSVSGQRIASPSKGVNIVDGKKVMMK